MKAHRPWLVAIQGRTGSSTVARLLHEEMGISMGEKFGPADDFNKDGYYEDQEFYELDCCLLDDEKILFEYYMIMLNGLILKRVQQGKPWGLKNPWIRYMLGFYVDFIRREAGVDPIIVTTRRPLHWACASLMRMKPDKFDSTHKTYVTMAARDAVWKLNKESFPELKFHEFWFRNTNVPDEEVLAWLKQVQEEEGEK